MHVWEAGEGGMVAPEGSTSRAAPSLLGSWTQVKSFGHAPKCMLDQHVSIGHVSARVLDWHMSFGHASQSDTPHRGPYSPTKLPPNSFLCNPPSNFESQMQNVALVLFQLEIEAQAAP